MPTQSVESIAVSTIASGFTAGKNAKAPESTFVWAVEEMEACGELRVRVNYGGSTQTNNVVEVHIPWGNTSPYQIGPGRNDKIKVQGDVKVAWGNFDQITKKYTAFVVVFSGTMTLVDTNGISSSDQSSSDKNWIIVYAHLA